MELLQVIWFFLWGLLWAIFFITDGYDFGVAIVAPIIYKDKREREIALNSINPLWNANEVWLLLAGGVTFAAFPKLYSVMFAAFYLPLTMILFAIIIRGVSLEFKHQSKNEKWQKFWGYLLFISSLSIGTLLGIAFANIFKGVAIDENGIFTGGFFSLLNPYALIGGLFFLSMFIEHGLLWISLRCRKSIGKVGLEKAGSFWYIELLMAMLFLIISYFETDLYKNYFENSSLFLILFFAIFSLLAIKLSIFKKKSLQAFLASSFFILSTVAFALSGLFPNMFPSTINKNYSITLNNSSASFLTLKIMLIIAIITIPLVIAYQAWAVKLFKLKNKE